jgi:glycosyltransferase involved in cell wall biosynthesis
MLYKIYQQVNEFKPNIIHSHIWSWLIGFRRKIHSIVTVHSYKSIARRSVSILNDLFYVKIMPHLTKHIGDEIVCVGQQLQQAIQSDVNKNIKLIGNPIDKEYFIKEPRVINDKEVILVTCALLTPRKRIEKAIELTQNLNLHGGNYILNIIGPASDKEYFFQLKKQVTDSKLEQHINFLGALTKKEIIEQYKKSDLGVFFSKEETFGLAPLEMLATGLPLLSTKVGILADREKLFKSLGVIFIDNDNTDEHLRAAKQLLNSKPELNINALKQAFSVHSIVEQYESLYNSEASK